MIPDSMQFKVQPCVGTLTKYLPRLQLIRKCCVYIACFATAFVYTNRSLAALLPVAIITLFACSCKLLCCGVPGCSDYVTETHACMCW